MWAELSLNSVLPAYLTEYLLLTYHSFTTGQMMQTG